MEKNTKPKVIVEWIDAESIDPWTDLDEIDDQFPIITSTGTLLLEGEDGIVIAGNYDEKNQQASCIMKIPHGMIRDIKTIKS